MESLKDAIIERIRDRYGSVPRLAEDLDIPDQTIYSSLKGNLVGSSLLTAIPILNALDLDPAQLVNGKLQTVLPEGKGYAMAPLYRSLDYRQFREEAEGDETFPIPYALLQQYPGSFLLRVNGDELSRVLPPESYALVHPGEEVQQANLPYALCIGEAPATIMRVKPLANGYWVAPDSLDPTYKATLYDRADSSSERVRIIGRVVWFTLPFDWDFSPR